MLKFVSTALSAFLLAAVPAAAQKPSPFLTASYFTSPPVIDGRLEDACWTAAEATMPFVSTDSARTVKEKTVARVGYTANTLYVGFECWESRMTETRAEYSKDGGSVWLDDCIELFVAPHATATKQNYVHFGVNIAGAKSAERAADGPTAMAWTAKTHRYPDRWTVEIAIPLKTLQPIGTNADMWRFNFCRYEIPSGDGYSSWSPIDASFHDFWRFGRVQPQPDRPAFTRTRGTLKSLATGAVGQAHPFSADTPAIPEPEIPIIPAPRHMKSLPGRFRLSPQTPLVIGDFVTAKDRRAAEEIQSEIAKILGYSLPIIRASEHTSGRNAILVGEPWHNRCVRDVLQSQKLTVTPQSPGEEGYVVKVTPSVVVVAGSDQAGTFWGAQTLRQMIRREVNGEGYLRSAQIRDWPQMMYRGVHLLTSTDGLAFHGKCIEDVFSKYKVNHIVLEAEHVRWDSHPEVFNPERGMSKDDVRELIRIANEHHITVTPLIQSLGHMEWAFFKGSNLDLAEDIGTPYAFCPRNEKGYQFMFDIMDEAIELFGRPQFMHIGHDEVTNAGRFPVHEECVRIGKHTLYVDDILRYYAFLKERGVGTMIWGDVMTQEGYRDQIERLPKDIVIFDWRYSAWKDFPTLDFYQDAGFPLVGCTWYEPANLHNFSVSAKRRNILGMCQTTWTGFLPSRDALSTEYYQVYSYILGAEWAWSPGQRKPERMPYDPERVFARDFGASFQMDPRNRYDAVPLDGFFNVSRTDRKDSLGWIGLEPGEDLASLPEGSWNLKGVPFHIGPADAAPGALALRGSFPTQDLPEAVRAIPVGRKASALHFLQATGWPAGPGQMIGRYVIHYADGTQQEAPLHYGTDIRSWHEEMSSSYERPVAWRGRTSSRRPVAVRRFTLVNPAPDKDIRSVDFEAAATEAAPILLATTAESRR